MEYDQHYPDVFQREYVDEIQRKYGVLITEQAVSVHLRKLKWKHKKTESSLRYPPRSTASNSGSTLSRS